MTELLKRHYEAIKKRGLINQDTEISHFVSKMNEEFQEVMEAYFDSSEYGQPSQEFIDEYTDLVMVVLNMFTHLNIPFENGLIKNIKKQESRIYIGSKPVIE